MQRHREHARLIGVSARIAELRSEIENIALSDAKVLITGESGSGKEVVARPEKTCAIWSIEGLRLFNMESRDYKRFLNFLRKHDCRLPFRNYRRADSNRSCPGSPISVACSSTMGENR